jgi:hypothetical protein
VSLPDECPFENFSNAARRSRIRLKQRRYDADKGSKNALRRAAQILRLTSWRGFKKADRPFPKIRHDFDFGGA